MTALRARRGAPVRTAHGIDRMVRPLLVTMVGGMGLLAAILRREQ